MFKIVGNNTPSLDKDIPNCRRRQFENKVADAVNEADGHAKSETRYKVVD